MQYLVLKKQISSTQKYIPVHLKQTYLAIIKQNTMNQIADLN